MYDALLKPSEVDRICRWPPGKCARLARRGELSHVILPDGQIRVLLQQLLKVVPEARPAEVSRVR